MTSRVDMHCHSTASQLSRLGVQRSLGLPECATPPRGGLRAGQAPGDGLRHDHRPRHDRRLPGAGGPSRLLRLRGADRPLRRRAPGGTRPLLRDHSRRPSSGCRRHAGDVEACAAYLHENEIACALAHPFYNVDAPLTRRHRRRLAELFPVWEVRNGSRAAELNMPAVIYIETHGGTGIGGSDDHAGVDIGRTFTEAPAASTPEEFLRHMRARRRRARRRAGQRRQVGARRDGARDPCPRPRGRTGGEGAPDPAAVLKMAQRVIGEGAAREGKVAADIGPDDARTLLESWLRSVGIEERGRELIAPPAVRGLLPRRPLPARPPHARAAAARVAVAEGEAAASRRRPGAALRRPLRCAAPGRPLRARDRLPRRREGEARGRRRAAQGGADRRRDRGDARRHPHDRADPRARRARLRGRGGRHRPRGRPPAAGRGRRSRSPSTRG